MSLSMTDYRCKLIDKILFARSEDEVRRFIEVAMKGLREHQVNGHLIARFVEKACHDLGSYIPETRNSQQWTNIDTARIQFNQLKKVFLNNEKEIL